MTEAGLLEMLAKLHPIVPVVFAILGMLVVVGQTVVWMTPSKADDEAWEKIKKVPVLGNIISALANFAPLQKK